MCKNKKITLLEAGFSLVVAILFLLVCSKSSPLYPMNDWVDTDCIFTVGKSMGDGAVLYKDIFDHKGPWLYFIFMLSSFISSTSFIGVWLFEIISISGLLFFSMQSAKLFIKNKWVIYTLMPVQALIILTTKAFTHGGSCEELALLPLSYSLYYFLRIMKDEKLSKTGHIIAGACVGVVFWMKFTMVGFYIGAYLTCIIYRLYKKEKEQCVFDILWNIAGFLIVSLPVFVYFMVNGALKDLWEVYFYDNIFLYGDEASLGEKLKNVHTRVLNMTYYNNALVIPIYVAVAVYLFKGKAKEASLILASFTTAVFGIYFGGYLSYYAMIIAVFAFLSIGLTDECLNLFYVQEKEEKQKEDYSMCILPVISVVVCFVMCFNLSSNVYLMDYKKEDMPQYKFAKIINSVENPTLLNYQFLDGGFYFAADIKPINKYFYRSNLLVPGMDDEQKSLIRDKKVDFVVKRQDKQDDFVIGCGYEVVAQESFYFEGKDRTYFLYERKDLRN
ncbi:MAG: hypothetical protein ACI3XA_07475 [Clostridia bacterium]